MKTLPDCRSSDAVAHKVCNQIPCRHRGLQIGRGDCKNEHLPLKFRRPGRAFATSARHFERRVNGMKGVEVVERQSEGWKIRR